MQNITLIRKEDNFEIWDMMHEGLFLAEREKGKIVIMQWNHRKLTLTDVTKKYIIRFNSITQYF